jgi:hypothetical protein
MFDEMRARSDLKVAGVLKRARTSVRIRRLREAKGATSLQWAGRYISTSHETLSESDPNTVSGQIAHASPRCTPDAHLRGVSGEVKADGVMADGEEGVMREVGAWERWATAMA